MKTALIVLDATPTFMPGGELPVPEGDRIVEPILRLMREGSFDEVGDVHEEHPRDHMSFASRYGKAPFSTIEERGVARMLWPDHALAGTEKARLHPLLAGENFSFHLLVGLRAEAECFGILYYEDGASTGLFDLLRGRGIGKVVLAGLATDYAVTAAARQTQDAGFATTVILEACRGIAPESTAAAIASMRRAGVTLFETVDAYLATGNGR
jgi:nicotinamidase/pyrazinamidase